MRVPWVTIHQTFAFLLVHISLLILAPHQSFASSLTRCCNRRECIRFRHRTKPLGSIALQRTSQYLSSVATAATDRVLSWPRQMSVRLWVEWVNKRPSEYAAQISLSSHFVIPF